MCGLSNIGNESIRFSFENFAGSSTDITFSR